MQNKPAGAQGGGGHCLENFHIQRCVPGGGEESFCLESPDSCELPELISEIILADRRFVRELIQVFQKSFGAAKLRKNPQ